MAIGYVGGQTGGFLGTTAETTVTFSLTGGLASVPAADDLVVVSYGVGGTSDVALYVKNASGGTAYTIIGSELYANSAYDANLHGGYRFMPATPETSLVLSGTGSTDNPGVYTIHVFRGVDQTTPMDVAVVTATGIDTILANPGSITPITSGAVVYVAANGGRLGSWSGLYTNSELTDFRSVEQNDTYGAVIGSGYKAWTSGAFDPVAYGYTGVDSPAWSCCAITAALRPKSFIITDALAIADALATKLGKVLTDAPTILDAMEIKTGKVLTDALTLTDAVSFVLSKQLSVNETLSILDALSLKTGKPLSESMTLLETIQAVVLALPTRQDYYMPRPLITLTIGAETKRYSTETLFVPTAGQVGVAQVGESQVGG